MGGESDLACTFGLMQQTVSRRKMVATLTTLHGRDAGSKGPSDELAFGAERPAFVS